MTMARTSNYSRGNGGKTPSQWITPQPAPKRHKYLRGEVGRAYDLCHAAWRAGVVTDFYYGARDERDATIVWRLNGFEYDRSMSDYVFERVTQMLADAGIVSARLGERWCGFQALHLTLSDGTEIIQRYDGSTVRAEVAA